MSKANTNTDPQSTVIDSEKLTRQLDLELMMKRAEWKNLKAKRRGLRTLAFMILFLAIAGGVVAFVFSFSKMREGGLSLQHSATERAEAAPANH